MKFIIRDDDISYHFQPEQLAKWYEGIVEICPISICIPPFIKGDFFEGIYRLDHHIKRTWEERMADGIYKIGDNQALVDYIKELLHQRKASVGLHGMHHRNDEEFARIPMKGNFVGGAEFYTQNDYTDKLHEAKTYLEKVFETDINYFTPPQNLLTSKGLEAIVNNNLSLCTDLVGTHDWRKWLHFYGYWNTIRMLYYKKFKRHRYPFVIKKKVKFIDHTRLQPGKNIEQIKQEFDYVLSQNGVFVLSTHCYAFDNQMEHYDMTMKEALLDILHYSQQFDDVEYTTLHDLFK